MRNPVPPALRKDSESSSLRNWTSRLASTIWIDMSEFDIPRSIDSS
jgi:hypothetical protein